jgi:hypothetical protein
MPQENEVVMLALGCGVFAFALAQWAQLRRIPRWHLLCTALFLLLVAWAATVLEGFVLPTALNLIEHACYALAAVLVAVWCWQLGMHARDAEAEC